MTITIGPITNVPAPGDPIRSNWCQTISHYVVDTPGMLAKNGGTMTGVLEVKSGTARPLGVWGTGTDAYVGFFDTSTRHGFVGMSGAAGYIRLRAEDASSTVWLEGQGNVVFATGASYTERGRFESAGTFLVGKTVSNLAAVGSELLPIGRLYVTTDTSTTGNNIVANINSAAVGDTFASFRRNNTEIGSVRTATTSSVAFNTTSDPRLKENLGPLDNAADLVRQLGSKAFAGRWLDADTGQPDPTGELWAFLSSHDVEDVAPYAVTGERDAVTPDPPLVEDPEGLMVPDPSAPPAGQILPQQVDYSALVPLLTAALAQALDRIAALEAQLAA